MKKSISINFFAASIKICTPLGVSSLPMYPTEKFLENLEKFKFLNFLLINPLCIT